MSAWDADPDELIAAGWGSHLRHQIPNDWRTRRGPDAGWGKQQQARGKQRKRLTWRERRAQWEAAQQAAR